MKKTRIPPSRKIGRGYDKLTPLILEKINCDFNFQSYRTNPIEILYNHIIEAAGIMDKMTILDSGCGIGGPSLYIAGKLDVRIEAINYSNVQVNVFRDKIKEEFKDGKIFVTYGDFHYLDRYYPPSHFDVIMFLESFGHAAEPEKVIASTWKVLKEGGVLYIKDPLRVGMLNLFKYQKIKESIEFLENHYGFKFYTKSELRRILEKGKFKDITFRLLDLPNSDLSLISQYETIANIDFFGRGKPPDFWSINYYEIKCIK